VAREGEPTLSHCHCSSSAYEALGFTVDEIAVLAKRAPASG
jgi:hypothetical protein